MTQTDAYTYPSPSPLPSSSITAAVTQTVTTGTAAYPGGSAAVSNLHSVENDVMALRTNTITTDAWLGFIGSGSSAALGVFGTNVADGNNPVASTIQTIYTAPQQSDLVVETNGASWSNSPAASITEKDADGFSATRTINADGSYIDTQSSVFKTNSGPLNFVIATKADGSGSYTGSTFPAIYNINGLFMSAPSAGKIAVTYTLPAPSPSPSATPAPPTVVTLATPPAWFAPGTALYKESDTLTTGVAYPAGCAVPSWYGTTGGHIAQVIDSLDPVIGITDHKTVDTYTNTLVGPVCMVQRDTQISYYDYLNDTSGAIAGIANFAGTPQHTMTLTETLTLSAGASVSGAQRAAASPGSLSPVTMALARARFDAKVTQSHAKEMKAMQRFVETRLAPALSRGVK